IQRSHAISFVKVSAFDSQLALSQSLKRVGLQSPALRDASDGKLAWNVEYRVVPFDGAVLLPMINLSKEPVTVQLPELRQRKLIDLLSDEPIAADAIKLDPMVPRLLRAE